jgi:hypothetical protein
LILRNFIFFIVKKKKIIIFYKNKLHSRGIWVSYLRGDYIEELCWVFFYEREASLSSLWLFLGQKVSAWGLLVSLVISGE